MDENEARAKRIAQYTIGQDLADFSVNEISETIKALKEEVERLETTKAQKSSHMSAAEALFKK